MQSEKSKQTTALLVTEDPWLQLASGDSSSEQQGREPLHLHFQVKMLQFQHPLLLKLESRHHHTSHSIHQLITRCLNGNMGII